MREDTNRRLHESPEYRQEQLSAALDGMLAPDEQAALDAHLVGCEACAREMKELRQVRALLRALPEPALPRSFLLPVEDEPVAPRGLTHTVERQPAMNVTPIRQPTHRAARTLQVTRWIGTIAAVLGLALFLGTLVPTLTHSVSTFSSGAPAQGLDNARNSGAPGAASATGELQSSPSIVPATGNQDERAATATPSPSPSGHEAPAPAPTLDYAAPGPSPGDVLRIIGLVLLFAGAALALLSFILARWV